MSLGQSDKSYCLHCMNMCSHVSISISPHGQWIIVLGKNLCQYSPIGAYPSIMQVNLEHTELETPIYESQDPSLAYVGLIMCSLSSSNSKKSCLFFLLSLNNFCHVSSRRSHSFFLLSKNEFFSRRIEGVWTALASLFTMEYLGHFSLLEQYQNCIELRLFFLRNTLIFMAIEMMDFWRGWLPELIIFCSATKESVMTIMCWTSLLSSIYMRPMHMAMSLASTGVMLMAWVLRQLITLLFFQMWATAVTCKDCSCGWVTLILIPSLSELDKKNLLESLCYKLPVWTKNSMARGIGRTRVILGQSRQGILIIEKKR